MIENESEDDDTEQLYQLVFHTRDYDLIEHNLLKWASSKDNLFQPNFNALSDCEAI